ncbi:unnamed protein product [Diamesa serratosioi]
MSFEPLHRDKKHKYTNGQWIWNAEKGKLKFHPHEHVTKRNSYLLPLIDVGLNFTDYINEPEEEIFCKVFQRPKLYYDSEVITIQDIKNIVLFNIRSGNTKKLVDFVHTDICDRFLNSLIIYIDYFLLVLEYLLIGRDEILDGKIRDTYSLEVERYLSKLLSDRRTLTAREYEMILFSSGQSAATKNTSVEKEMQYFESIIHFSIQCVYIAMRRRAFNTITCEINRLFRTNFFNIAKKQYSLYEFDFREEQILFGLSNYNNSMKNYRQQMSPLIAESFGLLKDNQEVLKSGVEKYQGTSKYLLNLELEYSIPESQIYLVGLRRGILGHPKSLYDTMLNLNENSLRKFKISDNCDPYGLLMPAFIEIYTSKCPNVERFRDIFYQTTFFTLINNSIG